MHYLKLFLTIITGFGVAATAVAESSIILQSTTSTANSGLYQSILPVFTGKTGIRVDVVAVGTGQALKNARNGDGDVLLVHAKAAEQAFVSEGYGVERFDVMYNDFILVGPATDPAGVNGATNITEAFKRIASAKVIFVSRGDDSGTHKKEMSLWNQAETDPTPHSGDWYRETGSGMGITLNAAVGMAGYVLTDQATWLNFNNKQDFEIHAEGDERLFNQYGVILVNPEKHPHVKAEEGQAFVDWILGAEGQRAIADYKVGGKQLFIPNAR